jgi:dCMP deaminase
MRDPQVMLREAVRHAEAFSDDPRTHVGAILLSRDGRTVAAANQITRGIHRDPARLTGEQKYRYVEHAERSAIYLAARSGIPTDGATLFCTWYACLDCARGIILAGVREVVGISCLRQATPTRWEDEIASAERILAEAGVSRRWICDPLGEQILFDGRIVAC